MSKMDSVTARHQCPKCGTNMVEKMWDDHYAYPPYTNVLWCKNCGHREQALGPLINE